MTLAEFHLKDFTLKKSASFPADRKFLIDAMESEVKKTVKCFETDFYNYDVHDIEAMIPDSGVYLWITRKLGTFLFPADRYEFIRSVCDCYGKDEINVFAISIGPKGCTMEWLRKPEEVYNDAVREIKEKERKTLTA